jgi:hypothetical protein
MDDRALGWVMGYIDADGSILLNLLSSGRRAPRISVPSTDRMPLAHLKLLAGGYIISRTDKRKHVQWAWMWVLSKDRSLELLRDGWDLLRVPQKRARAKLLVDRWKWGTTIEERDQITEEFFAIPDEKLPRKTESKEKADAAMAEAFEAANRPWKKV